MLYEVTINGQTLPLELAQIGGRWQCRLGKDKMAVDVPLDVAFVGPDTISLIYKGKSFETRRESSSDGVRIWIDGESYPVEVSDPRSFRGRKKRSESEAGPRKLIAPMPGKVVRVLVGESSEVEAGQGIIVIEAMKMQNEIKSPKKGRIQKIAVQSGASVNAGDLLAVIE
ncbi:MAG TPA: biotin/lipoyl-containing protein [Terriglobales bacterium]|jgi:biotin carboxyl carrier protein